jgi:phage-related protein
MNKLFNITVIFALTVLSSCQTVSKKIDTTTAKEEKELSRWLQKTESELKIFYGQPDEIKFKSNTNRVYVYVTEKIKIKCERKFEINPNNVVIGFSSKNCF